MNFRLLAILLNLILLFLNGCTENKTSKEIKQVSKPKKAEGYYQLLKEGVRSTKNQLTLSDVQDEDVRIWVRCAHIKNEIFEISTQPKAEVRQITYYRELGPTKDRLPKIDSFFVRTYRGEFADSVVRELKQVGILDVESQDSLKVEKAIDGSMGEIAVFIESNPQTGRMPFQIYWCHYYNKIGNEETILKGLDKLDAFFPNSEILKTHIRCIKQIKQDR